MKKTLLFALILFVLLGSSLLYVQKKSSDKTIQHTNIPQPTQLTTPKSPTTWRTLVMIYQNTDVIYTVNNTNTRLVTTMTPSDKTRAVDAVSQLPETVRNWSAGFADVQMEIVYPALPIKSISSLGSNGFWVSPENIRADIDTFVSVNKYDSIIVIWKHDDDNGQVIPSFGFGWSLGPATAGMNGAGYSVITIPENHAQFPPCQPPSEIFVHEWLHQVTSFYETKGFPMPNIDAAGTYGYTTDSGTCSWKSFLSDVMQGKVRSETGTIGITPHVWASGTPIDYIGRNKFSPE